MKISIVTPSKNQAKYIEECLWSVKCQGDLGAEHIVVDGVSTDGTVEILKKHESLPGWGHLRWISEPDRGQSDALNKGFRMATGDVFGWLNSDDRYRRGCFQCVAGALEEYKEADIVYGDYTWINESGRVWQVRREIEFSRFILSYHRVLYIPTTATFFRRRIFDEGNLVDLRFHYAMDYEFFLRLAQRGYQLKHVPHLLADFRWHGQNKSGSAKQLVEHNHIAEMYSPLLQKLPGGLTKKFAWSMLRAAAAGLRYSEKLARGYYLTQFRPERLPSLNEARELDSGQA